MEIIEPSETLTTGFKGEKGICNLFNTKSHYCLLVLFIPLFIQYLLSKYYVEGTIDSTGNSDK